MKKSVLVALICASIFSAHAQFITPTANLVMENIPPITEALTKKVEAYTQFKPSSIIAWHPSDGSILVRMRLNNSNQLHLVKSPGAKPEPLTDFQDAVSNATFQPKKGEYLLFARANGGDEVFRIYRMDLKSKTIAPISPEGERAGEPAWNREGNRIVFTTASVDRKEVAQSLQAAGARKASTKVYIADPLKPESAKVVATFDGGGFSSFRFSPDEKSLAYLEYVSAGESHLWMMDIASGKKTRITAAPAPTPAPAPAPKAGAETVAYGAPRFAKNGKGIYTVSDRDSEYRRLVHIDIATGKETVLTPHLKHDVDEFSISNKAKRIAITTNEEGSSVLRFLDLDTGKELPRPALLTGEISGMRWKGGSDDVDDSGDGNESEAGNEIAFNLTSARSPGEVYSMNVAAPKVTRWTNGSSANLNPMDFVEPKLIRWKSFDNLMISGFIYQPDTKNFQGKRPVIINIHGGPEAQARPG